MEKLVGIIGGLGPKATASFIAHLIDRTDAGCDQEHINFLLKNHATVPDRTAYILDHSKPNPLPVLMEDVKRMAEAGVDFIVIPCNTAYYFYDELQAATSVPIVHMIAETARTVRKEYPFAEKVGILATEGTLKANLYQKELEKERLRAVVPPAAIQQKVNAFIYDQVKRRNREFDHQEYFDMLQSMLELGCDAIVLGCTELSVIEEQAPFHRYPVVDAQMVLVDKTIALAGKKVRTAAKNAEG